MVAIELRAGNTIINQNGEFIYDGTPGVGNLSASSVPGTTTVLDPFGNVALPGDTVYQTPIALDSAAMSMQQGIIIWYSWNGAGWGVGPSIDWALPNGFIEFLGAPLRSLDGTASSPTLIITDSWNSLGSLTGYTVNSGRYRLTTWGSYEIDVNVTSLGANAANTTFSIPLPAGYSGGSSTAYPLTANYVLAAGDAHPRLIVTSGGAVTVAQTASKSGLITGQAFVPAT